MGGPSQQPDWEKTLRARRRSYLRLEAKVSALVAELLIAQQLDVSLLESRTKDPEHVVEKVRRKGYADPLNDITDLVGLRIVTYYLEDHAAIREVIESAFEIDLDQSRWGSEHDDPARFGYESDHYIVSLPVERTRLPEWSDWAGVRIEIQVRTVLQHAWAAISHKLAYKQGIPLELQRQLTRLSALLELADEQFAELRDRRADLQEQRTKQVQGGRLDLPIDAVTVQAFLDQTALHERWLRVAQDIGFAPPEREPTPLFEQFNDVMGARFISALSGANITSLGQLSSLLDSADVWGRAVLNDLYETCRAAAQEPDDRSTVPYPNALDVLTWLIVVGAGVDDGTIDQLDYFPELSDALRALAADGPREPLS